MSKNQCISKEYVDPDTGQLVQAIAWIKPDADGKEDFVKVHKLFNDKVMEDFHKGLNGAYVTFQWFIKNMPMNNNVIPAPPEEIIKDTQISLSQTWKHIKILKEMGYLIQPKARQNVYEINMDLVYKGTLKKVKS